MPSCWSGETGSDCQGSYRLPEAPARRYSARLPDRGFRFRICLSRYRASCRLLRLSVSRLVASWHGSWRANAPQCIGSRPPPDGGSRLDQQFGTSGITYAWSSLRLYVALWQRRRDVADQEDVEHGFIYSVIMANLEGSNDLDASLVDDGPRLNN
jgi:hypothetical protein